MKKDGKTLYNGQGIEGYIEQTEKHLGLELKSILWPWSDDYVLNWFLKIR